ncbi:[NiFe] hydrogenase diaphorase moiety large subunit [Methylomarinovum tepidoasis]|uniref:NADH-quinone oxidoreductase subunit F n=1 Tax=Methylomarinovum tepidoasis TaxID=2840183 RepID=A0AAU9CTD7_9GAMM|nr:NAD(P)H-dependent oxidoreductase subunit E [Methylomarinovum sp. IN45]BCX89658.1 [NiFe] hydrogenase diaphorase moiety large subunit [Methylomarinovum sp. IN45]
MDDPVETARQAVADYGTRPQRLLVVLRRIQQVCHHVPRPAQQVVAEAFGLPLAQVEGVIEFYHFLHTRPRGDYEIYFSDCVIDAFQGFEALMQRLCGRLGVGPGQCRADGRVSVDTTACTGLCDQGPALLVNGLPLGRLTPARIDAIAERIEAAVPVAEWPPEWFEVAANFRQPDKVLGSAWQSGAGLRAALRRGAEWLLDELQASGLRGRGGAGFPTALKWKYCRQTPGAHYVVCNADEGEPGTFKDRELLRHHADQLFEGMTLAALVTGARQGFLYLRGEYQWLLPQLEEALRRRRREGLVGRNICALADFHFDIDIVVGAGAYICGEESALLNSIEGVRPHPRNRPPYPVTCGLWGQPTVVNNVESFAAAALVAARGGAWFAEVGTEKSKGTKVLSVSGDCDRPGIYEVPLGITVAEVLDLCGAGDTLGVQVGGPSGTFVHPPEYGRRIAYEDLGTGGSFMVFGTGRDLIDIVHRFARFFAHESCGFCTPCRVGTQLQLRLLEKVRRGWATAGDIQELEQLRAILAASHCGLGHTAANPVQTTLARCPERYRKVLRDLEFSPGFDLDAALEAARQLTGRFGDHLSQE